MWISIRVPVGRPLPEAAEFVRRCEAAGLDGVGVHDHPHSGRDAYLLLALAGGRTSRLALFPATSSPRVRHPLLLASLAASLEEVAPGRTFLTVAPGFLSVRAIGQSPSRLKEVREAVQAVRRLLAGEGVVFGGQEVRLRYPPRRRVPVLVLAGGPRMVELAGEVADGALLMVGLHPGSVARARRHLEAGARRAGRSLEGFRQVFIVTLALGGTDCAEEWVRGWFAPGHPWLAYPSASNLYWLREAGFDLPEPLDPSALSPGLARRIGDAFGLFGPPERCAERLLQAREEAGVEEVFLFPAHRREDAYTLPEREVSALERVFLPRLK